MLRDAMESCVNTNIGVKDIYKIFLGLWSS